MSEKFFSGSNSSRAQTTTSETRNTDPSDTGQYLLTIRAMMSVPPVLPP